MVLYQLNALRRCHGTRTVLELADFSIASGEAVCLTGPNGAGKSTLLHLLALLDDGYEGEIVFGGTRVCAGNRKALRRNVVLVEQHPVLFSGSVAGNVAFGLKQRKTGREDITEKVKDALSLCGISHLSSRSARGLSGGEIQRVAMARALAIAPAVLLCDEPTANIDPESRKEIWKALSAFRKQGGTLVYSTHDPERETLSESRRIRLVDGEIRT